jgi:uncharacterized protein HemX
MADRIVERTDGVTERVTEPGGPSTVVVERSGGGAGVLIAIVLLIAVAIGAYYLINQNSRESAKTDAVTSAAKDAGSAAKDVGSAAKDAVKAD